MNVLNDYSISELKEKIQEDYNQSLKEAKKERNHQGYIRSRGKFIATCLRNGEQCEPSPEADASEFKGTKKQIEQMIEYVSNNYPDVFEIYIAGGFDWAESVGDYYNDNYEPWDYAWKTILWTRE